jgi:hypothetical protein
MPFPPSTCGSGFCWTVGVCSNWQPLTHLPVEFLPSRCKAVSVTCDRYPLERSSRIVGVTVPLHSMTYPSQFLKSVMVLKQQLTWAHCPLTARTDFPKVTEK